MKNVRLAKAVLAVLFTAGAGVASAHDLLGGTLAAAQNSVDVFRTTCFSYGDGIHPSAPVGEVNGFADRFKFAVSLTQGSTVTATVGYTPVANVTANAYDNNVLPAAPAPKTATTTDTSVGAAWNVNSTQPDFATTSPYGAPAPFGSAVSLIPNGAGVSANGDYVIVISHASAVQTKYDFLAHCQRGATSGFHTGQGTWFTGTAPNVDKTADYDQVLDQ